MERLHAVAVVHVQVHVQDAQAVVAGSGDPQGDVVVDTESAGSRGHRVVQPTAGVVGMVDVAAQDRLHGPDRAAGHGRRRLVHARERRVVAGPDARLRRPTGIGGEAPHGRDVLGRVEPFELAARRGFGRQPRFGAHRSQQVHPRPETPRAQRVVRPEVVRERARPEDQQRATAIPFRHGRMIARLAGGRQANARTLGRPDSASGYAAVMAAPETSF